MAFLQKDKRTFNDLLRMFTYSSPVIPTERIQAAQFYVAWFFSLPFLPFAEYVPAYEGKTSKNCQK